MNHLHLPWVELLVALPLLAAAYLSRVRDLDRAHRESLLVTAVILLVTVLAWGDFILVGSGEAYFPLNSSASGSEAPFFVLDDFNAPLLSLAALLYFVTNLATLRTKLPRFSLPQTLISEAILLATFACHTEWGIVALLGVMSLPVIWELRRRGASVRQFALHTLLCFGFLAFGCYLTNSFDPASYTHHMGVALMAIGVLLRCGVWPLHCWMRNLFDSASFGTALLYVTPMTGIYAAMRLVLPHASAGLLQMITIASLFTACYAAALALVQKDFRAFFSYVLLSHCSLVLVGVELATPIGLTGSLSLWLSVAISLTGFGLTLRSVEAREGRLSLDRFHGFYSSTPKLAGFFLLTGLASVGFPGTIGFIATELLIEGAVDASPAIGVLVVLVAALNGIAVLKAFFRLFTGTVHHSSIPISIGRQERVAVLILSALIIGGGLCPHPGVVSRYNAAIHVLADRDREAIREGQDDDDDDHDKELEANTTPPETTPHSKQHLPRGITLSDVWPQRPQVSVSK